MSDTQEPPRARFRGSRWPGLIWAVPVAAAGIVLWLGLETIIRRGPEITVRFATAGGLKPGTTSVKYQGMTVGNVDSIQLTKSLSHMNVTLRFDSDMAGHLGPGTQFWIAGRSVSFSNLASLKSVISGPYIGVAPQAGKTASHFIGLAQPPVIRSGAKGETLTIITSRPGNLSRGAPIYFNHFQVGKVLDLSMAPTGKRITIDAFVNRKYAHLVSTRSRFWNAGAVSVGTGGAGPKLMLQSVPALFTGALGFQTPPGGHQVTRHTTFRLYSSKSAARAAPGPHAVPYRVVLAGGPHGLARGAAVKLEGADAGVVTRVALRYDPASGRI